jgi:F-type H+-transporting ATPase subunit delta
MSSLTTLARPYAKAAFDVAQAAGELAAWDEALAAAAVAVQDARLAAWLESPARDRARAAQLIADVVTGDGKPRFRRFLEVLADNDRLALLPEIAPLFARLREEAENRLDVRVVSAIALEPEQAERMTAALRKRFSCEISLRNEIDPAVLGGAIIYAGDQVIDGSLKGRLANLQRALA